jgi:hypothetical protein
MEFKINNRVESKYSASAVLTRNEGVGVKYHRLSISAIYVTHQLLRKWSERDFQPSIRRLFTRATTNRLAVVQARFDTGEIRPVIQISKNILVDPVLIATPIIKETFDYLAALPTTPPLVLVILQDEVLNKINRPGKYKTNDATLGRMNPGLSTTNTGYWHELGTSGPRTQAITYVEYKQLNEEQPTPTKCTGPT